VYYFDFGFSSHAKMLLLFIQNKSDSPSFLLKILAAQGGLEAYASAARLARPLQTAQVQSQIVAPSKLHMPSAPAVSTQSVITMPSGICITHSFITKRIGIRDIINMPSPSLLSLTTADPDGILKYASSVLHIEVVGIPILDQQLKKILCHFPFLEGLSFTDCDVSSLAGISSCPCLRHFHVRGHCFDELPAEMSSLRRLWTLEISSGTLRSLPSFIGELSNLHALIITNTLVSELPVEIGQLKRLRALDLGRCPIASLPDSVRKLRVN